MSAQTPSSATDRCPRCGGSFHCGMNDAAPCPCTGIVLDAATLAQLRQRYSACLCLACLHSLAAGLVREFTSLTHGCG